jgi:hypothetical protein
LQHDTLLHAGSKSTGRDGYVIVAGSEIGDAVFTAVVGVGLLPYTRGDRGDGDAGAGDDGSAVVCNRAHDCGVNSLCLQGRVEEDEREEEKDGIQFAQEWVPMESRMVVTARYGLGLFAHAEMRRARIVLSLHTLRRLAVCPVFVSDRKKVFKDDFTCL